MKKNERLWLTLWRNAYEYSWTVECHEMSNSGLWHACSNLALSKCPINIRPEMGLSPNWESPKSTGWYFPSQHRHLCGKNVLRIFRHSRHRCAAAPAMHSIKPIQWKACSLRFRKMTEKIPVKNSVAPGTVELVKPLDAPPRLSAKKNLENTPFTQDMFYIFIIFPVKDVKGILWSREQCWTPRDFLCQNLAVWWTQMAQRDTTHLMLAFDFVHVNASQLTW